MKSQPAPDRSTQVPPVDTQAPAGFGGPNPPASADPNWAPPGPYPNAGYPGAGFPNFPSQPGQFAPSYPMPQEGAHSPTSPYDQTGAPGAPQPPQPYYPGQPAPGFPGATTPAFPAPDASRDGAVGAGVGGGLSGFPAPGAPGGAMGAGGWAGGFAGEARAVAPFDVRQYNSYLGAPLLHDQPDVLDVRSSEYTMLMGVREHYSALTKDLFAMLYKKPRNPMFLYDKKNTYAMQMLEARVGASKQHYLLGLRGLVMGPLGFDVWLLRTMLREEKQYRLHTTIEILVDRPPAEIRLLKNTYNHLYGSDLVYDIQVSAFILPNTKEFFRLILERSEKGASPMEIPNIHGDMNTFKAIQVDVNALNAGFSPEHLVSLFHRALSGTDAVYGAAVFFDCFSRYSNDQLTTVNTLYKEKYKKNLTKGIKKMFMFDQEKVLMHVARAIKPKKTGVQRDAKLIEASMRGWGTKDDHLVSRIVRYHWDTLRWGLIKDYFTKKYKPMEKYVASETSGDYKKLMCALITGTLEK